MEPRVEEAEGVRGVDVGYCKRGIGEELVRSRGVREEVRLAG